MRESWFLRVSAETAAKPSRKREKKVCEHVFAMIEREKFGNCDPRSHCPCSEEHDHVYIVENGDILIEISVIFQREYDQKVTVAGVC
jgi:hypothetical protein